MAYHDKHGNPLVGFRWKFTTFNDTIEEYRTRYGHRKFWRFEMEDDAPSITKVKKIKKTINLIGRDDSPMIIAGQLHQILRKANSYNHIVDVEFLEWTTMRQDQKLNYLRWLLERHPIPWAVNEISHEKQRCAYRLTYPTLADL